MGTNEELREQRRLYMREWRSKQRGKNNAYMREYRQEEIKMNKQSEHLTRQCLSSYSPDDISWQETLPTPLSLFGNAAVYPGYKIQSISDTIIPTTPISVCKATDLVELEQDLSDGKMQSPAVVKVEAYDDMFMNQQSVILDGKLVPVKQEPLESEPEFQYSQCPQNVSLCSNATAKTSVLLNHSHKDNDNIKTSANQKFNILAKSDIITKQETSQDNDLGSALYEDCESINTNVCTAYTSDLTSSELHDVQEKQREQKKLYMRKYRKRIGEQYNVYMREYRLKRKLTKHKLPVVMTRKPYFSSAVAETSTQFSNGPINSQLSFKSAPHPCTQNEDSNTKFEHTSYNISENDVCPSNISNNCLDLDDNQDHHAMFMINGETHIEKDPVADQLCHNGKYITINKFEKSMNNATSCPSQKIEKSELNKKFDLKEQRRLYMKEYRKRLGDGYNAYMRQYRLKTGLTKQSYKEINGLQVAKKIKVDVADIPNTVFGLPSTICNEIARSPSTNCDITFSSDWNPAINNSGAAAADGKQTVLKNRQTDNHLLNYTLTKNKRSAEQKKETVDNFADSVYVHAGKPLKKIAFQAAHKEYDVSCRLREWRRLYMQSYRNRQREKCNLYVKNDELKNGITKCSFQDRKHACTDKYPTITYSDTLESKRVANGFGLNYGGLSYHDNRSPAVLFVSGDSPSNDIDKNGGSNENPTSSDWSQVPTLPSDVYIEKEESDVSLTKEASNVSLTKEESDVLIKKEESDGYLKSDENCLFTHPSYAMSLSVSSHNSEVLEQSHVFKKNALSAREYRRNYMRNYRNRQREKYNAYMREYRQRRAVEASRLNVGDHNFTDSINHHHENRLQPYSSSTGFSNSADISHVSNSQTYEHHLNVEEESYLATTPDVDVKKEEDSQAYLYVAAASDIKEEENNGAYLTDVSSCMEQRNLVDQSLYQTPISNHKGTVQEYRRNYMRMYRNSQREKYNAYMRDYRRKKAAAISGNSNMPKSWVNNERLSHSIIPWPCNSLDTTEDTKANVDTSNFNTDCTETGKDLQTHNMKMNGSNVECSSSMVPTFGCEGLEKSNVNNHGADEHDSLETSVCNVAPIDVWGVNGGVVTKCIGSNTSGKVTGADEDVFVHTWSSEHLLNRQKNIPVDLKTHSTLFANNLLQSESCADEEIRKAENREQKKLYMRKYRAKNKEQTNTYVKNNFEDVRDDFLVSRIPNKMFTVFRQPIHDSMETDNDNPAESTYSFSNSQRKTKENNIFFEHLGVACESEKSIDVKTFFGNIDFTSTNACEENMSFPSRTSIQRNCFPMNEGQEDVIVREKRKLYMREYRQKNRDKYNAYMREYRRAK